VRILPHIPLLAFDNAVVASPLQEQSAADPPSAPDPGFHLDAL
jgi:hypothetical protein